MTREDGYAGLSLARLGSDSLEIMTFGARRRVDVRPHIGGERGPRGYETLSTPPVTLERIEVSLEGKGVTDLSDTVENCQIPVKRVSNGRRRSVAWTSRRCSCSVGPSPCRSPSRSSTSTTVSTPGA